MRAIIYARISRRDNDKTSIPNQIDACRDFATSAGWEIVATHIEPGESAENLDRPELAQIRIAAREHAYDVVLISALDRLTRNLDDLFLLRREFTALEIPVHAIQDDVELTTANDDQLLKLLFQGYFGQREQNKIKERLRRGRERSIRDGHYPGGPTPFGYRRSDDNYLVVDDEDKRTVEMIFSWCVQGDSTHEIAKRLDQFGIPTPQGRTGRLARRRSDGTQAPATKWSPVSVRHILRNEIYLGTWTYNATSGPIELAVEPIIDPLIWQAAQDALTANRWGGRKPKQTYLLKGKIRCVHCNSSYCGRQASRPGAPHYYACLGRTDYKKRNMEKCTSAGVNGVELETAIWTDVEAFIRQPHLVIAEIEDHSTDNHIVTMLDDADRAIAERKIVLDRYLTQYGRGIFPDSMVEEKARQVQTALDNLYVYRDQLHEQQRRDDLRENRTGSIVETLTKIQSRLDAGLDIETKRAIVKLLVRKVIVKTKKNDHGKPRPVATVIYSFEDHPDDTPIPVELSPLFSKTHDGVVLHSSANRANQYHSLFQISRVLAL